LPTGHACVPKRHFGVQAWVNPAESGTSNGGQLTFLRELEEVTLGELRHGSET